MNDEASCLGVYIHIPFCRTRCPYCDFVSNAIPGIVPLEFVNALCGEIRSYSGPKDIASIFVGGGTPSLLTSSDLEKIFDALLSVFNFHVPEITLEANPDDINSALVREWRVLGINRVSLGVQSLDTSTLRYLGRRHNDSKALKAIEIVAAEFDNWSMDLIFGAPPMAAWRSTLEKVVQIQPPHISAYSLTYEPSTPFGSRMEEAFDEEQMLFSFRESEKFFSAYDHYEISNFARPGFQCRHNLLYWHNDEYAGFGPGAFSYIGGRRMCNTPDLALYIKEQGANLQTEVLCVREQKIETLIQHFRLREGIAEAYYKKRFGESIDYVFEGPLNALQKRGLIRRLEGYICPTDQGFYLNNEIGLALVDVPETCSQSGG